MAVIWFPVMTVECGVDISGDVNWPALDTPCSAISGGKLQTTTKKKHTYQTHRPLLTLQTKMTQSQGQL